MLMTKRTSSSCVALECLENPVSPLVLCVRAIVIPVLIIMITMAVLVCCRYLEVSIYFGIASVLSDMTSVHGNTHLNAILGKR